MKPRKISLPVSLGMAWRGGAIFQQKLDGRFALREVGGHVLAGELVAGQFVAFDVLTLAGQDVRAQAALARWQALNDLAGIIAGQGWQVVPSGQDGGKLLADVLASGGEGIVRKEYGATYFDAMTACKRLETFLVVVTGINSGQSVKIAFTPPFFSILETSLPILELEHAGNLSLKSPRIDGVRIGSILKVEAFGRHKSGLLREARPCQDTPGSWLVRF